MKYKYNLFKDWRACKEAFEGGQVVPVSRFTDPSQAARTASDAKEHDRSHSSNVATCHASKVNFKQSGSTNPLIKWVRVIVSYHIL